MSSFYIDVSFDTAAAVKNIAKTIKFIDKIIKNVRGYATQINAITIKDAFLKGAKPAIATKGRMQGRLKAMTRIFHVEQSGSSLDKSFVISHPWENGTDDRMFHTQAQKSGEYKNPIGQLIFNYVRYGRGAYTIPAFGKSDRRGIRSKRTLHFYWKKVGRRSAFKWKKGHYIEVEADNTEVDFWAAGNRTLMERLNKLAEDIKRKAESFT